MTENIKYEVVIVGVNPGFTDVIMDAAKKHGVKGGTIISSRVASNEKAVKNYGISITADKELVFMVVESSIKNDVINAIYKTAGIETHGRGVICSIPVDNVVGLNKPKEEKKPTKKNKK